MIKVRTRLLFPFVSCYGNNIGKLAPVHSSLVSVLNIVCYVSFYKGLRAKDVFFCSIVQGNGAGLNCGSQPPVASFGQGRVSPNNQDAIPQLPPFPFPSPLPLSPPFTSFPSPSPSHRSPSFPSCRKAAPLKPARESGERCKLPSGVWGEADIDFGVF